VYVEAAVDAGKTSQFLELETKVLENIFSKLCVADAFIAASTPCRTSCFLSTFFSIPFATGKTFVSSGFYLPGGQVMVGQHWSSCFSTRQFLPTGLMKGQTLHRKEGRVCYRLFIHVYRGRQKKALKRCRIPHLSSALAHSPERLFFTLVSRRVDH
jgi:hypothetical protein